MRRYKRCGIIMRSTLEIEDKSQPLCISYEDESPVKMFLEPKAYLYRTKIMIRLEMK